MVATGRPAMAALTRAEGGEVGRGGRGGRGGRERLVQRRPGERGGEAPFVVEGGRRREVALGRGRVGGRGRGVQEARGRHQAQPAGALLGAGQTASLKALLYLFVCI